MTAIPIRIANAVVTELNHADRTWGVAFKATRGYADWDKDFEDLKNVSVDVVFVTRGWEIELDDRSTLSYSPEIDIAVRKRFGTNDRDAETGRLKAAKVDPLVDLLEDIFAYFSGQRNTTPLQDEPTATWKESEIPSWINQGKLRRGSFEGVVRLTYEITKTNP
jgi:hypothetical protein